MTPGDQQMYTTVNLLVFLYHARKENGFNLSEEQQYMLLLKQEYLDKAGITLPVFHNTLKLLDKRGYLMGFTVLDDEFHSKVHEFLNDDTYNDMLSKIPDLNAEIFTPDGKEKMAEKLREITPPQYHFDEEGFKDEKITIKEFLDQARGLLKNHRDEIISYVFLLPFRSVEKLLEQLNAGRSFDEIQDSGTWYDPIKFEFHLGDQTIPVSYQGKPNIEHDVLAKLDDNLSDGVVWYDDVDSYKPRPLKDALIKFIDKHKQLGEIFIVHADRLEFDKKAFE